MTEQPMDADWKHCEHFWVSKHVGNCRVWVRQCEFCNHIDAEDLNRQIHEIVGAEIVERYHPEFGSEWQEGGSLSEIVRAAQEEAFDLGMGAGIAYGSDPNGYYPPNPYRKES